MNIYFWALIIVPRYDSDYETWIQWTSAILYALVIILVYVNNLYLAPRYLPRRKYVAYALFLLVFGYVISLCYTYIVLYTVREHPGVSPNVFTLFQSLTPVGDTSVSTVLQHTTGYYFIFICLTLVFTMAWYVRNYFRGQKVYEELKKKQTETQLTFLKGQINPHFLFNTLNNIYGLSIEHSEHTSDSILKLSSIMRYMLHESNVDYISFAKEKEAMLAYIDLELLRLQHTDDLHFSITSDREYSIPPLLWLPILENVFKHGTRFIDKERMIDFKLSILDHKLSIYSENKFKPLLEHNGLEQASGIGLSNLRQRLEILYPGRYSMHTRQDNEYYTVELEIELKK